MAHEDPFTRANLSKKNCVKKKQNKKKQYKIHLPPAQTADRKAEKKICHCQ